MMIHTELVTFSGSAQQSAYTHEAKTGKDHDSPLFCHLDTKQRQAKIMILPYFVILEKSTLHRVILKKLTDT